MALKTFPPEVWELILDHMKRGPDILNVLNTFPELREEGVQHLKKTKWLFPSIIPVLCEWLSKEENENCRQVCKTWRSGIEHFTSIGGCPITNKKELYVADPGPFPWDINFKFKMLRDFTTVEALNNFRTDMEDPNHARDQSMNPFLMRRATFADLYLELGANPLELDPHHVHFWNVVLDFLKTYGHHLWSLEIDIIIDDSRSTSNFLNFINCFLEHVPNLKCLSFSVWDRRDIPFHREVEFDETGLFQNIPFAMPKLESLVLPNNYSHNEFITKSLIRHFGKELGGLSIHVSEWEGNYANQFTNLTVLFLNSGEWREEVAQILSSIEAPGLATLGIDVKFSDELERLWENFIPILARFPKLEALSLWRSGSTGDDPKRCPKFGPFPKASTELITKLPSVKFVEILFGDLGFDTNLLSCFPNLQNLLISYPIKKTSCYIQHREIWEVACPKLQDVLLSTYVYEKRGKEFTARGLIRICRSHYEHFKSCRKNKCTFEDEDEDIELADVFGKMGVVEDA